MNKQNLNKLLSQITFVTSIGDFISLFAVMVLTSQLTGNFILAAFNIPIKSLGIAIGGLTFPWIMGKFRTRSILICSEFISGVLAALLVAVAIWEPNYNWVYGILLVQTVLKQYFDGSRESYSKSLASNKMQRSLQAEILNGFYSAQVIGPIIAFILLKNFPIYFALLLDCLSFLIAGFMAFKLLENREAHNSYSIFSPFSYLKKNTALAQIFLLRSIGYWIPIGIFNFLLIPVIEEHYNTHLLNSAWAYAVIGLGSVLASQALVLPSNAKDRRTIFEILIGQLRAKAALFHDGQLAFGALLILAVTRISFIYLPAFWIALGTLFVGGICNGTNAVATQSLRRKLASAQQLPEIIGLEIVIGRIVDFSVATLCKIGLDHGLTITQGIWFSAVFLFFLAWMHLSDRMREVTL